jgi:hypothetical protein
MTQPLSFSHKQREMFARMLMEARQRAEAELESETEADSQAEGEILRTLAEEHGATPLIAKIRQLRKEIEVSEQALDDLGFRCDDDNDLKVKWNAPKVLQQAVDTAKRSARAKRLAELKQFDRAVLAVWAAENVQEAKQIVEKLL